MSIQKQDSEQPAGNVKPRPNQVKRTLNLGLVISLVLGAALISTFYGTSAYKTQTEHVVELADGRSKQFEVVFNELLQARFRSMGIGADTLLQSRVTIEPFVKRDRVALGAKVDPFFTYLKSKHGIAQLNFWIPPVTMFYRAGAPELGQMDASKFRHSIAAANARQERIMAVEAGQGGLIGIRGIVPVMWDEKFYGVLEFVSDFSVPLHGASEESHFKWAQSISKEKFAQVERPRNEKEDAIKGDDVYINYSDSDTRDIIRTIDFDPRSKDFKVADKDGQKIFVRTFPVFNFDGLPTITIAIVDDLTSQYDAAFKSAVVKGLVLFLLLSAVLVAGYLKLDHLRAGILGSIVAEKRLLKERLVLGEAAIQKLRDVDTIKRRFFSNLMVTINQPLLAISGRLGSVRSELDARGVLEDSDLESRLGFAISESEHLQHLVSDYAQIELFRQNLVSTEVKLMMLADVVKASLKAAGVQRRLPGLKIHVHVPHDLPPTHGDTELFERAISSLVTYAAHVSGVGEINIAAVLDDENWLALTLSGSAFAGSLAPSTSLLDEAKQFLVQLSSGHLSDGRREKIINILLAKIIIEHFGGTLTASSAEDPGFIARFHAAT